MFSDAYRSMWLSVLAVALSTFSLGLSLGRLSAKLDAKPCVADVQTVEAR